MNDTDFEVYTARLKATIDMFERAQGKRLAWDRDEVMRAVNAKDASGKSLLYLTKDGALACSDDAALAQIAPSLFANRDDDRAKVTRAMAKERASNPTAGRAPDREAARAEIAALKPLPVHASDRERCERASEVQRIYQRHGY